MKNGKPSESDSMEVRSKRPYLLWLALLSGVTALLILVMLLFALQQRNAIQSNFGFRQDSLANLVFQYDREYLRLSRAIRDYVYETPDSDIDSDIDSDGESDGEELRLRADIFHSRLALLLESPSAVGIAQSPEFRALAPRIEAMDRAVTALVQSDKPDRKALRALLPQMAALEPQVQNISFVASDMISATMESRAKLILGQNQLVIALTLCQLLLLIASTIFLLNRHRSQSRAHLRLLATNHKLQQNEERLALAASVFNHSHEGIVVLDRFGLIVEANNKFCSTMGLALDALKGFPISRFIAGAINEAVLFESILDGVQNDGHWGGEMECRRADGTRYPVQVNVSPVLGVQQQPDNYVIFMTDISAIKQKQLQLEYVAHFDVLTGLPNRVLLLDRLQKAISNAERQRRSLAVGFIDLDGFKEVNDNHGHAIGDQLLVLLSRKMEQALRTTDSIARLGGDEFVVLITDLENKADCIPVLERLLEACTTLLPINDSLLQISASIGVTVYPEDHLSADQLVRHADQAMYQAKQSGKNQYFFFDSSQEAPATELALALADIKHALEHQEFVLYYQPKVNMRTGAVVGAEALIRWQHPHRGLLAPAAFLPLIEDKPISIDVSKWVIATATQQMLAWEQQGTVLDVSVNASALHLQHPSFFDHLLEFGPTGRGLHGKLSVEILETTALSDIDRVREKLLQCQRIGINFSLDDFGTGYSSLSYLSNLPVQELKIDQTFVRTMNTERSQQSIVEGVIGLARAFGKLVIAEGVETLEHGEILLKMGCDCAQGYAISRPLPADQIPEWILQWRSPASWHDQVYIPRDPSFLLDQLIQGAPVGVAIINYNGRFENFNPVYSEIYGYSRSEMQAESFTILFPPDFRDAILARHQTFLQHGGDLSGIWTITRKDGQLIDIRSYSVRVPGEDNQVNRLVYITPLGDPYVR